VKLALGFVAMVAAAAPQQLREPAPRLERIEMTTTTWGRPLVNWSIDARGNFTLTQAEPDAFEPRQFVTRSYAAGTAGFRQMRVLLGVPETRAGHRMPCTITMTDQVSGTVKWVPASGRTYALDFYTACKEYATRQALTQIGKAGQLASEWAKLGTVTETRAVEQKQ